MWRKTTAAKPSSQFPTTPAGASAESVKNSDVPSVPSTPAKVEEASRVAPSGSSVPYSSRASQPPAPAPLHSGAFAIPSGLKIHGTISGSSDLSLDSEMHGKIWLSDARLSIGPNGRVHADVEAREIVVNGKLTGNLKATESIRLGPSARFKGSVVAPRIGIDEGAQVRGKVEMSRPSDTAVDSESVASESDSSPKASARAAGQVSRS